MTFITTEVLVYNDVKILVHLENAASRITQSLFYAIINVHLPRDICQIYKIQGTTHVQSAWVAVKIIDTNKILQKYVLKNLYREAKLLSKLNHPNIIRLYETIQCGAVYYLVTELATGGDLGSHVRSQPGGRLDEVSARCYARQLADGLQHMHSKNIVHR
ncbi:uncharacterized protein LOC131665217 [Phymastichus coffea]|uniref:uncharacterized protein LOC131665217 n=1 Tax=Phymastichus coffea TaxID=108790 RepID=UPI00273CC260|nr:uncharacterized protein LOC131665217 [Phymastichus coffea]